MPLEEEQYMDDYCPKCGVFYDDVDFDSQKCHNCGFENSDNIILDEDE